MTECSRGARHSCHADAPNGCAFWMRETGVDEDGWMPPRGAPSKTVFPVLAPDQIRAIDLGGIAAGREIAAQRGRLAQVA